MELWLDTIDFNLIKQAAKKLQLAGVTTNPSILSHSTQPPLKTIAQILSIQPGRVAVQVTAQDAETMLMQARHLASLDKRIIIKIPVTNDGLFVIKQLAAENIDTMATAIFEPRQVYLSALAGALYAAPYFNHIEQKFGQALSVLASMQQITETTQHKVKIIAAAIASVQQLLDCMAAGSAAITIPAQIYHDLTAEHRLTLESLERFDHDWRQKQAAEIC